MQDLAVDVLVGTPSYALSDDFAALFLAVIAEELGRGGLALTLLPNLGTEDALPVREAGALRVADSGDGAVGDAEVGVCSWLPVVPDALDPDDFGVEAGVIAPDPCLALRLLASAAALDQD
jgi:hypothetical protein